MAGQDWVLAWMNDLGIRSFTSLHSHLGDFTSRTALIDRAEEASEESPVFPEVGDYSVLASRQADMSYDVSCAHWDCQGPALEQLLRSTCHYFDKVVVRGLSPQMIVEWIRDGAGVTAMAIMQSYAETLLHLKESGGLHLLEFAQKHYPCPYHWEMHLEEAGLSHIRSAAPEVIDELMNNGELVHFGRNADGAWSFEFRHPFFQVPLIARVPMEGDLDPTVDRERIAAEGAFQYLAAWLVSDVRTAQQARIPLAGVSNWLPAAVPNDDIGEVALRLRIPVLEGAPIRELLAIREHEAASFRRFRDAVRLALKELTAQRDEGTGAAAIAQQVVADVIQPALHDIERKLEVAKKVLGRKTAVSAGVGSAMVLTGFVATMPLLVPAGIAAGLTSLAHYNSHVDNKRDVELSDMYFLWQVAQRVGHRQS